MRVFLRHTCLTSLLTVLTLAAGPISSHGAGFERCGTPALLDLIARGTAKPAAARLETALSVVSPSGHFRVHYDSTGSNAPDPTDADRNGIPDYIDSTVVDLEYAWSLEIGTLGYPAPMNDNGSGGGNETDVYVKNLDDGVYGFTSPDRNDGQPSSAYIVIDNNFSGNNYTTKGFPSLRVTTAHEFFHVIQFTMYGGSDAVWWMEQSATWMEERAWSDVNDYLFVIGDYFENGWKKPLDSFRYSGVLWPIYLSRRFGDDEIRRIWEAISVARYGGIALFGTVIPIGLPAALNEFGVWNWFTSDRSNPSAFYPEGGTYNYKVRIDSQKDTYPAADSLATVNLSTNYVEFFFSGNWNGKSIFTLDNSVNAGRVHANSLLFFDSPTDYQIVPIDAQGASITLTKQWTRAILVTTCVNIDPVGGKFRFSADYDIGPSVNADTPSEFLLDGSFPNPFNSSVTIRFTLPMEGRTHIRAYDCLGRKAADILDDDLSAGEKNVLWKPGGLSSGVYLVSIETPFGSRTTRVLYLR
jgi:hypothetical protein